MESVIKFNEQISHTERNLKKSDFRENLRKIDDGVAETCTICAAHIDEVFDIAKIVCQSDDVLTAPSLQSLTRADDAVTKVAAYLAAKDTMSFSYRNIDVAYQNHAIVACICSFELTPDACGPMAPELTPFADFFAKLHRRSNILWHIGFVVTDQSARRLDIVEDLFLEARRRAKFEGCDQLSVLVGGQNVARDFFERQGFAEIAHAPTAAQNIQNFTEDLTLLVSSIEGTSPR